MAGPVGFHMRMLGNNSQTIFANMRGAIAYRFN